MEEMAEKIIIALVVGVATSLLTVHLTLKKFYSEKWWEKKMEAYTNIIEALHYSKSFADKHINAEMQGQELNEEVDKQVRLLANKAHLEIDKYINMGLFLFSDKFYKRLKKYQTESNEVGSQNNGWTAYLIQDQELTEQCLVELIEIAKKDLK